MMNEELGRGIETVQVERGLLESPRRVNAEAEA
jgi:hypothetical protein